MDDCQRQEMYILIKLIEHTMQGCLLLNESIFNKYSHGTETTDDSNQFLNNCLVDGLFFESVH